MNKGQVISQFLAKNTLPELASLYTPEMETHVDVVPGPEKVATSHGGFYYTDPNASGGECWSPFRIPSSSGAGAELEMRFGTDKIQAIGMSGWNYARKQSIWVGFDFDSIVNHSRGLQPEQIESIKVTLSKWPWATVRASTSGRGLHIYVFFYEPIPTQTRTEHAALARSILGVMSAACGIRLEASVDCFGAILWVYHRAKMCVDSFTLIKEGRLLETIPHNWLDHEDVIVGKSNFTRPQPDVDDLSAKNATYPLTDEHKYLLKWFSDNHSKHMWWWDSDRGMLVCHTRSLLEAHKELGLRGPFTTLATGKDVMDHNCFAYPLPVGWVVRRYGKGTRESNIWVKDSHGFTRTYFDKPCDFETACLFHNGVLTEDSTYLFEHLEYACQAAREVGCIVEVEDALLTRQAIMNRLGENKIKVSMERTKADPTWLPGWAPKGKMWEKTLLIKAEIKLDVQDLPDDIVRYTRASGIEYGWFLKLKNEWTSVALSTVKDFLRGSIGARETTEVASRVISSPWTIDNTPFQPEEPGGRRWSRGAAQLAYLPIEGETTHWDLVFKNLGRSIDKVVKADEWCFQNGIHSGADYLFMWLAFMINRPEVRLPWLFLYSAEQDTGKSIFHESAALLFKDGKGVVRANNSLTSPFNGELSNAVLCVVEELNLSRSQDAYTKIKDWVTADMIAIRAMYHDSHDMRNYTHWVQCANDIDACPIPSTDTRIMMIGVYAPDRKIPKPLLLNNLRKEGPAMMHRIRSVVLPEPHSRLALPVLDTDARRIAQQIGESISERFFKDFTYQCEGAIIPIREAFKRFQESITDRQIQNSYTEKRFVREIPVWIEYGQAEAGAVIVNRTFDPRAVSIGPRLLVREGRVKRMTELTKETYQTEAGAMEL